MIVVTGATGQLGRLVVEGLLKKVPAADVVAAVRDPEKAAEFAARGVQVRRADYDDPASLATAFAGADKVLLISSSTPGGRLAQHEAVVAAAREAGVGHLAYTSILAADTTKLSLAPDHKATEEAIRASGVPFTFLRNGWYTENYAQTVAQALASGSFAGTAGEGRLGGVPRIDFAEAAVEVLTGEGHEGQVYELAGDEPVELRRPRRRGDGRRGHSGHVREPAGRAVPAGARRRRPARAGRGDAGRRRPRDRRGRAGDGVRRPAPPHRPPDHPARRSRDRAGEELR